jgi:hypothetical protein
LEPPLCVVSNWILRVYTILVWNTISGSSNLNICFYHCLILILIFHLKVLINFFFFFFIIIIIIISISISIIIIITIIIVVIVLLLFIIYIINLPVVRPRSCRVIYYFNTPTLGKRHQSFGRVTWQSHIHVNIYYLSWLQSNLMELEETTCCSTIFNKDRIQGFCKCSLWNCLDTLSPSRTWVQIQHYSLTTVWQSWSHTS